MASNSSKASSNYRHSEAMQRAPVVGRGQPMRLLYGSLSEQIHNPDVMSVFVLSDETEEYREFFKFLCRLSDMEFETIDADSARNPSTTLNFIDSHNDLL